MKNDSENETIWHGGDSGWTGDWKANSNTR